MEPRPAAAAIRRAWRPRSGRGFLRRRRQGIPRSIRRVSDACPATVWATLRPPCSDPWASLGGSIGLRAGPDPESPVTARRRYRTPLRRSTTESKQQPVKNNCATLSLLLELHL